ELLRIQFSNSNACRRHESAIPRRDAPELCMNSSPFRGRGERRVPAAPAASRADGETRHTSVVTTGPPVHPAFPHAMVLTVSFVLSPVTGLFCHRRRRIGIHRLDASV